MGRGVVGAGAAHESMRPRVRAASAPAPTHPRHEEAGAESLRPSHRITASETSHSASGSVPSYSVAGVRGASAPAGDPAAGSCGLPEEGAVVDRDAVRLAAASPGVSTQDPVAPVSTQALALQATSVHSEPARGQ